MNSNLKQWAQSLAGCDGGNIEAKIWLCGIEWGGGSVEHYYDKDLPNEIKNGSVHHEHKLFDWKDSITYPYGRSFAKLWTAVKGNEVATYRSELSKLDGSELFKLNLYPIAFDSTDPQLWHENRLDVITGFKDKHLFNTWCFFNRFPAYSQLRSKHKPKLIVCTGVNYLRDFLMFFAGGQEIDKLQVGTIEPQSENNKSTRQYYWVKFDGTLLVVIPFFSGRYGLNSDYLLKEMGSRIKSLLESK